MQKVAKTSDRIREAMEAAGLIPAALAEKADIPKSTLSRYLSDAYEPKSGAIYKLAQALDVSEAWLWGYDVQRARTPEQKKNDVLASVVVKMRKDPDFLDVVEQLAELPKEQYEAVKNLLSALVQK